MMTSPMQTDGTEMHTVSLQTGEEQQQQFYQGGVAPMLQTGGYAPYPTFYVPQPAPPQLPPQQLPSAVPSTRKCVKCGNLNEAKFNFCSGCGAFIENDLVPVQGEPGAPVKVSFLSRCQTWSLTTFAVAALVINSLLIAIWLFADHSFPWPLYPLSGTALVASIIYVWAYATDRKLLTFHFLFSVNLNVTILFTYMFAFTAYPWFIHVLFPTVGLFSLHYFIDQYRNPDWEGTMHELLLKIHMFSIVIPLNVMLFITFVASNPEEPWFLYPVLITALPLAIHYILVQHKDNPHKWIMAHVAVFSIVNLFFFMVWYLAGHGFPWCIFIFGITAGAFAIHYGLHFHRSSMPVQIQKFEEVGINTFSQVKQFGTSSVKGYTTVDASNQEARLVLPEQNV